MLATVFSTDVSYNANGLPTAYVGNNTITVGAGNDEILGGLGVISISVGNGNNVIIGHDGELDYTDGILTLAESTNPSYGKSDTITLGIGNDIVIGGFGPAVGPISTKRTSCTPMKRMASRI